MSHLPSVLALDFTLSMAKRLDESSRSMISSSSCAYYEAPSTSCVGVGFLLVYCYMPTKQGFPMVWGQNLWAGIVRIWIKIKAPKDHIHSISSICSSICSYYIQWCPVVTRPIPLFFKGLSSFDPCPLGWSKMWPHHFTMASIRRTAT